MPNVAELTAWQGGPLAASTVALRGYHSDSRLLRLAAASLSTSSDRRLEVKLRKAHALKRHIRWLSDSAMTPIARPRNEISHAWAAYKRYMPIGPWQAVAELVMFMSTTQTIVRN